MSAARDLRHHLEARAKALPRHVPSSWRGLSEDRARCAFEAGVAALKLVGLSQRAIAAAMQCDERMVRDYLSGARVVPLWAIAALPEEGRVAALRALLDLLPGDTSSG